MRKEIICRHCGASLDKDAIGLNKKLFENEAKAKRYSCISCMAEILECEEIDLREKIEEFKAEGCKLFGLGY